MKCSQVASLVVALCFALSAAAKNSVVYSSEFTELPLVTGSKRRITDDLSVTELNNKTGSSSQAYVIPSVDDVAANSAQTKNASVTGVEIRKGTVNENIIRIAKTELGIPASNVDFRFIPCDLIENYSYVIPNSHFENKYERLTYYASQYSFFSSFNPMTNTVTLEYRGPDVFDNCRKTK